MKEYEVVVTTTVTVYVEANSEMEALKKAREEAVSIFPDNIDAKILSANDLED